MHFTTVLDVRRARSDERVARGPKEFAFHHSFGRPTITFCVKGCLGHVKNCISPQFWASDEHEVTRGLSPAATYQTYPAEKKRSNFKEEQHFRRAAVSAALLSRFSQQPFSAALLSSSSQQLFSAAFLSSSSQQLFSAALLSSFSQQPFSAALLSSFSQQPFSAALLSSFSQQPFSAALLGRFSQQLFSAIILLWSGVGGQLVTSSSAALLSYHLAVVRGWWSASNIIFSSSSQLIFSAIILLWSGVGGQVCYRSLEGPFRNAFGKKLTQKHQQDGFKSSSAPKSWQNPTSSLCKGKINFRIPMTKKSSFQNSPWSV